MSKLAKLNRSVLWWAVVFVGVLRFDLAALVAQDTQLVFATRRVGGKDVLRVRAQVELPPSASYATAHVTVSNPKRKSPRDRDLLIVVYNRMWGMQSQGYAYRVPVRLAEGQSQVQVDIPFVHPATQSTWDVVVLEEGRNIEDESLKKPNEADFQWIYYQNQQPAYAALQGTAEATVDTNANLSRLVGDVSSTITNMGIQAASNASMLRTVPIPEASHDWRSYFPYRAWVLSAETVRELNRSNPNVARALRDYVGAGGILFVHSAAPVDGVVGNQDLNFIHEFLGVNQEMSRSSLWEARKTYRQPWWLRHPKLASKEPAAADGPGKRGKQALEVEADPVSGRGIAFDSTLAAETWLRSGFATHMDNASEIGALLAEEDFTPSLDELLGVSGYRNQLFSSLDSEGILQRKFISGTILVTAKPLTEVSSRLLRETLETIGTKHGTEITSASVDGNWFWKNLITAVGKPPVWTFCVMVAMFGAVLGPGLLFLTARIGRRSLMILLVPTLATLSTLAIIVYGVLHEGFDTYVRVTSLARIDTTANEGFAWSRQNYFSGLPPREGFELGSQTYARSVFIDEERIYGQRDPKRSVGCTVSIHEGGQNWRGWLKPRQQQQLLIGHPLRSANSPVRFRQVGELQLEITNQTEHELPFVVVCGATDDYYFVEKVGPGEAQVATAETKTEVGSQLAKIMVDYRPEQPPELEAGGSLLFLGSGNRRWRNRRQYDAGDVFNLAIKNYMSDRLDMEAHEFATIVAKNPAIEVPIQQTDDDVPSEGLHLVIGFQPW